MRVVIGASHDVEDVREFSFPQGDELIVPKFQRVTVIGEVQVLERGYS